MISIHQLHITAPFRYLWLKSVTGIDLRVHCAKCLLGQYDERIGNTTVELRDMELAPAPYYYLCGVSMPYRWSNNFHLAFREKPGERLEVNRQGVHIIIDNAEEIRFGWQDVPLDAPHRHNKAYFTCRNWQFAHWLARHEGQSM